MQYRNLKEEIIRELADDDALLEASIAGSIDTRHIGERTGREERIASELPVGREVCRNVIDRGHPAGPELFVLLDNGVIECYNARTMRHITDLIARPGQIYDRLGQSFARLPSHVREGILRTARENQSMGRNHW